MYRPELLEGPRLNWKTGGLLHRVLGLVSPDLGGPTLPTWAQAGAGVIRRDWWDGMANPTPGMCGIRSARFGLAGFWLQLESLSGDMIAFDCL